MEADIVKLGASVLVDGVPTWQAQAKITDDQNDEEPFGQIDAFQSLGFASCPAPANDAGYAQAVVIRDCGGKSSVAVGANDPRNAAVVGKLGPGDTAMFATGPGASSQVQCKAKKKQVVMATDDADKKTMMFLLDGKNKKVQLAARGAMFQIDVDGDFAIVNKQGTGLLIQGGKVVILGDLSLPNMTPGMALVQAAPIPQPAGPLVAGQLTPVLGVSK